LSHCNISYCSALKCSYMKIIHSTGGVSAALARFGILRARID
jgi:hypothetical protein